MVATVAQSETDTTKIVFALKQAIDWINAETTSTIDVPSSAGQLALSSSTALTFKPFNGDIIKVNGIIYPIPTAGIAGLANTSVFVGGVAAQNLAATTIYYVYCFVNSGVLTADFSTTAHATSSATGNVGVEIKSGDNTRTLIGIIQTNGSSQFSDSTTNRFVRSWFNRPVLNMRGVFTAQRSTASTAPVELNTEIRCNFVSWSSEIITASISGSFESSVNGNNIFAAVGFNGATNESYICNSQIQNVACSQTVQKSGLTEGLNFATHLGWAAAATTGNYGTIATNFNSLDLRVG
jgi:hypothetical protein